MHLRLASAVLILPGSALVYIPLLIHWLSDGWPFADWNGTSFGLFLALIIGAPSLALAIKTVKLFVHQGIGTPAPWDPPVNFVATGPYRFVRNPMITAVALLILSEALALASFALLAWMAAFFAINTVYFIYSEEPALERRFGEEYLRYKAAVPRWVPRLHPYAPGN